MSSGTRPKGNCGRPWQAAKPINRKCSALTEQLDRPFAFLIKALLFLPHDLISGFLFAKPLIRGVAQGIAAGPFGKFDLRDQLRFDPDRITPRQIGYGLESRLLLRNRLQLFKQACGFGPVEPGPDLAGKDQVLFIVDTLTTAPWIKPTSIFLRSARRPNPGRRSTYRCGKSVQTNGTSSQEGDY